MSKTISGQEARNYVSSLLLSMRPESKKEMLDERVKYWEDKLRR